MNRLRDEWGDDPVAVRGIRILRETPPTPRMPEMKRRVWFAQQQTANRRRAGGFRLSSLRVGVVVAGAILCIAGTSGAVIAARRWIMPAIREVGRAAPKVASTGAPAQHRPRSGKEAPLPHGSSTAEAVAHSDGPGAAMVAPAAAGTREASTVPAPASLERAGVVSPLPRASHPAPARRTAIAVGAPASGRTPGSAHVAEASRAAVSIPATATAGERTQVLDAMIALRRDHDPVSAGAMLDRYLTSHPNGALREEALVLAIEAAGARGDLALAKSLARAYQDAYPNGRFRRYAQDQVALGRS